MATCSIAESDTVEFKVVVVWEILMLGFMQGRDVVRFALGRLVALRPQEIQLVLDRRLRRCWELEGWDVSWLVGRRKRVAGLS